MEKINCKCIGMLSGEKWDRLKEQNRRVYSADYISPTLTTCGGGNQEVKIAVPICVGNVNPSGHGMNGNVFDPDGVSPTLTTNKGEGIKIKEPQLSLVGGIGEKKFGGTTWRQGDRVYDSNGIAATITAQPCGSAGGQTALYAVEPVIGAIRGRNPDNPSDRTPGIPTQQRLEIGGDVSNTLTTVQKDNVVVEPSIRVRKLTPKECWRLMDFDDADFEKAEKEVSNSQLYKQAGNSIVVNVLTAIFGQMIEGKEDCYKEPPRQV